MATEDQCFLSNNWLCCNIVLMIFLYYRSNFQFIWPWQEWSYVKDLPKWAPQRVFVQEVLEREIRLSYFEKIKQVSLGHSFLSKEDFLLALVYISYFLFS